MPLEKHHKIMIGSFSSFIIIVLLVNSIFLYVLFAKLDLNQKTLEKEITDLQTDTQTKLNDITKSIINNKNSLSNLGESVISLDEELNQELDELKALTSADFSGIIETSIESVVTIRTDVGQGTGFIITDDGYIVTNAHVLVGGNIIQAITSDQDTTQANFVGYEETLDLALLKIEGSYSPIELGDSDAVEIGEKVIAIGNPLGLQFSVSEGIISATDREGSNGIEGYLQTDAALNPGNSGGPLINKEGEVIGINNFKIGGGESLGFALESAYIKEGVNVISEQLLNITLL